jgi:hypothetical protein
VVKAWRNSTLDLQEVIWRGRAESGCADERHGWSPRLVPTPLDRLDRHDASPTRLPILATPARKTYQSLPVRLGANTAVDEERTDMLQMIPPDLCDHLLQTPTWREACDL